MRTLPRFMAPVAVSLVLLLAACGTQTTPTPSVTPTTPPSALPSATADPAELSAYSEAICPIFEEILELDPRITALRELGGAGGDVSTQAEEIEAVVDGLLVVLDHLEDVPDWDSGQRLTFELITSLHKVRTALLGVAEDPAAPDAAEGLAAIPYLATEGMDIGMGEAARNGLRCESVE